LSLFKKKRADIFAALQQRCIRQITDEKLEKATAYQLVGMTSLLHDRERLERDQSTHNVGLAEIVRLVHEEGIEFEVRPPGDD